MELEECIKDALEESMQAYVKSEKYQEQKQKVNTAIDKFQSHLDKSQVAEFIKVLDSISAQHSMFASEAYMRGVVEGIALHGKVISE